MILFIQTSRKCKLIYSDKTQISVFVGLTGESERVGGRDYKGLEEILGVMDMFIILIIMIVS